MKCHGSEPSRVDSGAHDLGRWDFGPDFGRQDSEAHDLERRDFGRQDSEAHDLGGKSPTVEGKGWKKRRE